MPVPAGRIGRDLLTVCAVPDTVSDRYAEAQPEWHSTNPTLTGAQRARWLRRRPDAKTAKRIAKHQFTGDELNEILTVERRKTVLTVIAELAEPAELELMLTSANRVAEGVAARELLRRRPVRTDLLVDRLEHLDARDRSVFAAKVAPDEMDDATLADMLAEITCDTGELWLLQWNAAHAMAYRPGLHAEFRRHGFPRISWTGAITSHDLTAADAAALETHMACALGNYTHEIELLRTNPWLARPGTDRAQLTGAIRHLGSADVATAWAWSRSSKASTSRHATLVQFALNANLGELAAKVAEELWGGSNAAAVQPWLAEQIEANWAENYPQLPAPRWAEPMPLGASKVTYAPIERHVLEVHLDRSASELHKLNRGARVRTWELFAEKLGDNPDHWDAALALADTADTLRELIELATGCTAEAAA